MKILPLHIALLLTLSFNNPVATAQIQTKNDTVFNQTGPDGKKQGYWKKTDTKGRIVYRGFFKNGRPVGEFKRYYDDGALKSLLFYHPGNDTVDVTFFYQNGKKAAEGKYYQKKKTGEWKYYSFYEDFLSYVENYKNGIKNGPSIKFYASGDTAEILGFVNGRREGKWEQFFQDGTPKLKALYKNDKLEGPFILYYPSGKKQVSGFYKHNSRDGKWEMFDKNGYVSQTILYHNGIAENADEIDKQQNALLDSLIRNKGRFRDPEKYGIDMMPKR